MRVETVDDVLRIYLRQSSINEFFICPERARYSAFVSERDEDEYTDATAVGTGLHEGIERVMMGEVNNPADMAAHCRLWLMDAQKKGKITYVKEPLEKLLRYYEGWCYAFWRNDDILDMVYAPDKSIEHSFCFKVAEWGQGWPPSRRVELWFEGRMDYVCGFVTDWKTASRPYNHYEYQTWAVQPTMYVEAAKRDGLVSGDDFKYVVFPKNLSKPDPDIFRVTRGTRSFDFLVLQGRRIADMILTMGTDKEWPIVDQHWLCSAKWCDNWSNCKGLYA